MVQSSRQTFTVQPVARAHTGAHVHAVYFCGRLVFIMLLLLLIRNVSGVIRCNIKHGRTDPIQRWRNVDNASKPQRLGDSADFSGYLLQFYEIILSEDNLLCTVTSFGIHFAVFLTFLTSIGRTTRINFCSATEFQIFEYRNFS